MYIAESLQHDFVCLRIAVDVQRGVLFANARNADDVLYASRLDGTGEFVWSPAHLLAGASFPFRLDVTLSSNNVALLTSGEDYEVVYVVDSQGEFAREVPYRIQQPRPVVGAAGLVAEWWHWAWERHGAPQVNKRFLKREKRPMTGYDWSAWMAVKVITEAVLRTRSTDLQVLGDYIRGDEITLDGVKGYPLDFRPWNNQLRQPIFLTTGNWVVAQAPLEGFLHQSNNLDTLGFDQRENRCKP